MIAGRLAEWQTLPVDACIIPLGSARLPSVQQNAYQETGRFPIVDQGIGLIAGYTDDESLVYRDELPIVVFGDHTRSLKFVDFSFATGADGTKLLRPNPSLLDPLFFYYALRSIEIPSRGYNRHYPQLRERSISIPVRLQEQRTIANILSRIEKRSVVASARCEALRELKLATMAKLFREGLRGERLKHTEIGEIPESWELANLGDQIDRMDYGTSIRCEFGGDGIPVLRIPNVAGGEIDSTELKFAQIPEAPRSRLTLATGDLLFVRTNGNRRHTGRSAVYRGTPAEAAFASYLIRGRFKPRSMDPEFVSSYLAGPGRPLVDSQIKAAADGKFNIDTRGLKALQLPKPGFKEQLEIVSAIAPINEASKAAARRAQRLRQIFDQGLSQLMTGAVRLPEFRDG